MGIQRAVGQGGTLCHPVAVLYQKAGMGNSIGPGIAVVGGDDDVQEAALCGFLKLDDTRDLCQLGHPLGLAGLKQFLDTGKSLGDVAAGQTAGMERTHGQLRAGLADGLGGDDANRLAGTHGLRRGQVHTVALGAHAAVGTAGQDGADHYDGFASLRRRIKGAGVALAMVLLNPVPGLQQLRVALIHHLFTGDQLRAGIRVVDVAHQEAAPQTVGEFLDDLSVLADLGYPDAVGGAAVLFADDDILRDVHHTAGQVTGVGGTQSGIGQTLSGTSGGNEIFQSGQALAVVCLNGDFNGSSGGVGD
ncbi:hypothetical protein SDC9_135133 [bioreactor metagenome]|uniref:Uncharacterized protein n=1 Tax=bioreactor metagenome TaxID=1076179 RepID=A0A645DHG1_9ZZZZ